MKDIKCCLQNDPSNDMAKRSKKKIEKEMGFFIQKIGTFIPTKFEKICGRLLFIFSISIFFLSWYLYYVGTMNINFLTIFSFGSLILIGISPFLSHITKLKTPGGIEIEKSPFTPIIRDKISIERPIHKKLKL